jgi:subtilisin family serine protease
MKDKMFKIFGKVLEKNTNKGIQGLIIEALDKDLIRDDRLGSAVTDEKGAFEITYGREDFQDLFFDQKPDIYLKVKDKKGQEVFTTKDNVRYGAGNTEEFIIYLPEGTDGKLSEKTQKVQVAVVSPDGVITGNDNKVTIRSLTDNKIQKELAYNERTRRYEVKDLPKGDYIIETLNKDGLKVESKLTITGVLTKENVLVNVGRPTMPYFYMGNKKIYFEPLKDRFAVITEKEAVKARILPLVVSSPVLKEKEANYQEGDDEVDKLPDIGLVNIKGELTDDLFTNIRSAVVKFNGVKDVYRIIKIDKKRIVLLTSEIIVRFKPGIFLQKVKDLATEYNMEIVREFPYAINTFLFRSKVKFGLHLIAIANALAESGLAEYAEPNLHYSMQDDLIPTDYLYNPHQWHLPLINAEAAWDVTTGDHDITICVYDQGLWINAAGTPHPDFDSSALGWTKVHSPWNFVAMNNGTGYTSGNNHGTCCCGVATALQSNAGLGASGLAPDCRLIPAKRHSSNSSDNHADAYIWASGFDPHSPLAGFPAPPLHPADVIVSSFGSDGLPLSGLMKDAFDFITTYGRNGKGCLMVFSAGNGSADVAIRTWASYEKTICVAASTNTDVHSFYSNFGEELDVCAPSNGGSDDICTTDFVGDGNLAGSAIPGASLDYMDSFGGTSSAAPLVAGLIGLILSANPDLTWIQVRDILRNTSVKIDAANNDPVGRWVDINGDPVSISGLAPFYSNWYGYGRINALAAVNAAAALVGVDPVLNVDTWIKDNPTDTGTVPTPNSWSPDVWVRNTEPALDNPAEVTIHQSPIRGQDNWVYANIRNRGILDSSDVYVRLSITRWAGTQYVYPDDFIPSVAPSTDPIVTMAPGTYLIGEVHIDSVPAGGMVTINTRWPKEIIPPASVVIDGVTYSWADSCLLVDVSPHDGPTPTGVHSWDNNNLTQRNITIVDPTGDEINFAFVVGNKINIARAIDLRIERKNLPAKVDMFFDYVDKNTTKQALNFLGTKEIFKRINDLPNIKPVYKPEGNDDDNGTEATLLRTANLLNTKRLIKPVNVNNRTLFKLPKRQTTLVNLVQEKAGFKIVALKLTGLKSLPGGEYQVDIYQQDTKGNLEGSINILFKK